MAKEILYYQNFDLRHDSSASRFFICSAFEIFYKLEIKGTIVKFEFLNIGSYFISQLLNTLAGNLIGKNNEDALHELDKIKNETNNHKYLTALDKRRFCNFLARLVNVFKE